MTPRRAFSLALTLLVGSTATLFAYGALFVVQTANADSACESYPEMVPGADYSEVRRRLRELVAEPGW